MKNKFKKLLISSLVLLGLSGCVKFNTTMDIKKDKSMDYSVIYGMTSTLINDQQMLSDEEKKELESKGFKAEDYKDDKYTGIKLTISFDNIDDVSTDNDTEFSLSKIADKSEKLENIFKVKKGLLKNTYTANFKFDQNDSGMSDTDFDTGMDDDTSYDIQSSPATSIGSLGSSKYDTFKTDVESIYRQALTKFASDSLTTATAKTYCNKNACTTPNETGVSTTSNYIVKLDKTGKVTYICVWNDSYIYEKKGTDIKITDINTDTIKVNSNVKVTKYTVATATTKEVPFAFTPVYQSLQAATEENDNSSFEDSMMNAMMSSMDLKYIVNLPYKAVSSNATQKSNEDKTLTWDLTTLKENENIKFEFYIYNMTNILIGAGVIVVVLIIVILLIVKSKKSKKDKTEPINNVENNNEINNVQVQPENTNVAGTEPIVSNEVNDSINSVVGLTEEPSQSEVVTPTAPVVNDVTAPVVDTTVIDTPVTEMVTPEVSSVETPAVEPLVETNVVTPEPVVETVTPVVEPAPMVETTPTVEASPVAASTPEVIPEPVVEAPAPVMEPTPTMETPVMPETMPTVEVPSTETIVENTTPVVENVVSVEPTPVEQVAPTAPVPEVNVTEPIQPIVSEVTPVAPVEQIVTPVTPVTPVVEPSPVVETTPVQTEEQNIVQ